MPRLIDIDNERFWRILFDLANVEGTQAFRIKYELSRIAVNGQNFVQCKDCRHWVDCPGSNDYAKQCELAGYMIGEDGYCLYGEVNENETD